VDLLRALRRSQAARTESWDSGCPRAVSCYDQDGLSAQLSLPPRSAALCPWGEPWRQCCAFVPTTSIFLDPDISDPDIWNVVFSPLAV